MNKLNSVESVEQSTGGRTSVMGLDYKLASILCYVPILLINLVAPTVFLMTEPKSNKRLRFHAIQGLSFCGVTFALAIANSIVMSILGFVLGALAFQLMGLISGLISLAFLGISIYGIYSLYNGQDFKLPVIGDFAEQRA